MTSTCPPPQPPTFLWINWEDCLQFSPSSMICYLPIAIEGACKVTVDHALMRNIFSSQMYYFGIAFDELYGKLVIGSDSSRRGADFLLRPDFSNAPAPGNNIRYWICAKDQWAYVSPSHSISKLSITLLNEQFQPLVWDTVNYPNGLNDFVFRLLLKIEKC